MSCARYRRWILRALADKLSDSRRERLSGHLAECADCRTQARHTAQKHRNPSEPVAAPPAGRIREEDL